jgi:hypothetical protein
MWKLGFDDSNGNLDHRFEIFDGEIFEAAMVVVASGAEVRRRAAMEAEGRSIGAAANRFVPGFDTKLGINLIGMC